MADVVLAKLAVQISANTAELLRGLNQAQRQFATFTSTIKGLGSAIGISLGATAIFSGLKAGIGILADFEHTMSTVRAITGATGDEFKSLEQDALRLGRSTKFTATQVGQLQIAYGRLGFTTKEILQATEATLDLAAATGEDLAKSADVAGSTVRGFGLDASETQRVVDVMASSFNKTALGLDNFTESMKYVAPVAAAANVTLEETTAFLGVLADAGIRGSTAGTSLRKIFTDLSKDGRPLQERIAELAKKGITLGDAFDEVGRTAQTSLLVITKNTEKANDLTKAFSNVAGEAARVARIMQDDLEGDVTKLTSAFEGLILTIKESDTFRGFIQQMTEFVNFVSGAGTSLDKTFRDIAYVLTKSGGGNLNLFSDKQILDGLSMYIERLKEIRREQGKPFDLRIVEELAEKYNITSRGAGFLRKAIEEANKALSFQEGAIKDFQSSTGAVINDYVNVADAAQKYIDNLNRLIVAETNFLQLNKQQNIDTNSNLFDPAINKSQQLIDKYLRTIQVIKEYIATLSAQKKKENEIAGKQTENLTLYEDLLKKKKDEFALTDVNDKVRLRNLAAEIAALQQKINKLKEIEKLAQAELELNGKPSTKKLTDQVLNPKGTFEGIETTLKFDPLKSFFTQFEDAIRKLRDSLTGLKEHVISVDLGGLIGSQVADMAFALGEAAVGVGNFGTAILKSVIGFAKQLGEILIASGLAMIAAKKLILTPGLAIAAGATLLAIAGAASAALGKAQQGFNGGGSGSSGSTKLQEIQYINRDSRVYVEGEFKLKNKELVAAIDKQNRDDNRIKPRSRG